MNSAVRKAEQSCIKAQKEQLRIANVVCFIALYRMGWDADKIVQRFNDATTIWQECREKKTSTLALLDEETGIELSLDGEKTYTEFEQLHYNEKSMTPAEYIYSLHRRKRWLLPLFLACLCLALHRIDGWEDELEEFLKITNDLRQEHGEKR